MFRGLRGFREIHSRDSCGVGGKGRRDLGSIMNQAQGKPKPNTGTTWAKSRKGEGSEFPNPFVFRIPVVVRVRVAGWLAGRRGSAL